MKQTKQCKSKVCSATSSITKTAILPNLKQSTSNINKLFYYLHKQSYKLYYSNIMNPKSGMYFTINLDDSKHCFSFWRFILFYTYKYFVCIYVHHIHAWSPSKQEEDAKIPWNWSLRIVVGHYVGAGSHTWVLCKSSNCFFNLWAFSPSSPMPGLSTFL